MNKKKAIKVLNNQKRKLIEEKQFNNQWIISTKSCIKEIFDIKSPQYRFMCNLNFNQHITKGSEYWNTPPLVEPIENVINRQNETIQFLENCINLIWELGVPNQPQIIKVLKDNKKVIISVVVLILIIGSVIPAFCPTLLSNLWNMLLQLISKS